MAELYDISNNENRDKYKNRLRKIIQSANLNFLIGAGCSSPAIKPLGDIENKILDAQLKGEIDKANQLMYDFLVQFVDNTKLLVNNDISTADKVVENYQYFLRNIGNILFNRKSNIIPCHAVVFSTNYDLLIEYVMNDFNDIILCDGFKRTSNINKDYYFSSTEFFNSVFNTGNLYRYKVEIPVINLIKLHGSINWGKKDKKIIQDLKYIDDAIKIINSSDPNKHENFNSLFNIILPQDNKLRQTILDEIYYDLLRVYSNELDKENTILITEGFSFADQHILEITLRALKNKTFNLAVFCYNEKDKENYSNIFSSFRNVDIISNGNEKLDFYEFNNFLSELISIDIEDD